MLVTPSRPIALIISFSRISSTRTQAVLAVGAPGPSACSRPIATALRAQRDRLEHVGAALHAAVER